MNEEGNEVVTRMQRAIRAGISRRTEEVKGVIAKFTSRHAREGGERRYPSLPPSLLPSILPSYATHDVANYAIKAAMAARKFLPLFTKGGGGCAGGTDKEGGKSQDNNLFVKIAESGEKRSRREISSEEKEIKTIG